MRLKQLKTLEIYACNMHISWNIHLKHTDQLEYTLETYVYSYCNLCNTPIYFCNTDIKHL
jgi:hypothetical protein